MYISLFAMALLDKSAAEGTWQEMCDNDWQGLQTLLGQKVLSATHTEQFDKEMIAEGISRVRLLAATWQHEACFEHAISQCRHLSNLHFQLSTQLFWSIYQTHSRLPV